MKRLLTTLMALLLLAGGGKIWADEQTATLNGEVTGFNAIKSSDNAKKSITIDEIVYTFNSNSGNTVTYDSGNSALKFQAGTSVTISSEGTITQVVITQTSGTSYRDFTASAGSISRSEAVSTWTGSYKSITLTNNNANAYVSEIEVTYTPAPDTKAPELTSTIPTNGATGQSDRTIILKFNEPVTVAHASKITISPSATLGTATVDQTDQKKVNIPCTGLINATKYTVTVASDAITDQAVTPNYFAGTSFSFITHISAPTITPNGGGITVDTPVNLTADANTTILYAWSASPMTEEQLKTSGTTYSAALTATPDGVAESPYLNAIAKVTIDGTDYYSSVTTSDAFADGTSIGVTAKSYPYSWIYDDSEATSWGSTATQVTTEGSGWTGDGTGTYYYRNPSNTGEGYDGTDAVEGLKFTDGFVGLDWRYGHMYVGANTKITIPGLTTAYKVTIKAGTDANGCTITATNADVDGAAYTPELTTGREEYVWYVTANGNVSFTFSGATWINYIKVEQIVKEDLTEFGREASWKTVTTFSEGASIDGQMVKISPTVPTSLLSVESSDGTVLSVKSVYFGTSSSGRQRITFALNVLKAGESNITIKFAGNERYNAATYTEKFTVNKPSQELSFTTEQVTKYPGADAFTNKLIKTNVKGAVTFSSSNTDVATVNENGKVTIVGSGTCNIIATAAETDVYAETQAFFSLVVVESFHYSVKKGEAISTGQEIATVNGITLRYGGFTDNFGKGSNHSFTITTSDGSSTTKTDAFKVAPDDTGLDGTYYAGNGSGENPRYEYKSSDGQLTNVRGWDRMQSTSDYLGNNVPVYGTFFVFEPEKDGNLTVSVLQTGAIQDVSSGKRSDYTAYTKLQESENYNGGIIDKWDYKALYLSDERGYTVKATEKKSYSNYSHPYVYDSDVLTEAERDKVSLRPYIVGESFTGESMPSNRYSYDFKYPATTKNDGTAIATESTSEKIKAEMRTAFGLAENTDLTDELYAEKLSTNQLVHIMENERYGYWTLTKSHNVYTFPVKAGKTYYLFTDGSKLSLQGFSFDASSSSSSTLTIDGADNDTTATTMGEKNNCTVTLSRKIIKNQPNSLMLPFSMTAKKVEQIFGTGTQVLHVQSIDNQIHFVRHHYQMIVAGEPCIIYPTFEGVSTTPSTDSKGRVYIDQFEIQNVTVEPEGTLNRYTPISDKDENFTFMGCFARTTMNKGSYWVSATSGGTTSQNQDIYLYPSAKESYMSNTRAFFQNNKSNTNAKLTTAIFMDAIDEGNGQTATGISIVENEPTEATAAKTGTYSIDGQKVEGSRLSKGIYIVNGKKVIVK